MTTNNTLFGTEWTTEPAVGDVPLVADTSSDMFSRPIDVSKYGLIYAGAQKNLGPSGVTLVIIREDLLAALAEVAAHDAELRGACGERLDVQHAAVLRHLPDGPGDEVGVAEGGLDAIGKHNERKAAKLYAEIDRSGFYRAPRRRTAARA